MCECSLNYFVFVYVVFKLCLVYAGQKTSLKNTVMGYFMMQIYLHFSSNMELRQLKQNLTSTIPVAHIRKSPYIPKPNNSTSHGEKELFFALPFAPLLDGLGRSLEGEDTEPVEGVCHASRSDVV